MPQNNIAKRIVSVVETLLPNLFQWTYFHRHMVYMVEGRRAWKIVVNNYCFKSLLGLIAANGSGTNLVQAMGNDWPEPSYVCLHIKREIMPVREKITLCC